MSILVVDDVAIARDRLIRLLAELGEKEVFEAKNAEEAKYLLENKEFHTVFLDIEMPKTNGLELAEFIKSNYNCFIIFATAYEQYALEAYGQDGIGYLLKPVSKEDVANILEKISKYTPKLVKERKILGKLGKKIFLIDKDEIIFITADLNEVIVRTKENSYYVSMKLSEIEKLLSENFFKVHRSHIVNIDEIKSLESIEQSKYIITFKSVKDEIISSKDGAKRLREFLEK